VINARTLNISFDRFSSQIGYGERELTVVGRSNRYGSCIRKKRRYAIQAHLLSCWARYKRTRKQIRKRNAVSWRLQRTVLRRPRHVLETVTCWRLRRNGLSHAFPARVFERARLTTTSQYSLDPLKLNRLHAFARDSFESFGPFSRQKYHTNNCTNKTILYSRRTGFRSLLLYFLFHFVPVGRNR